MVLHLSHSFLCPAHSIPMSQGWNDKVKPEQSSPQPWEWLWHVQDVVQTGSCCFTLPRPSPFPSSIGNAGQGGWKEAGPSSQTLGTGDTPQGCLQDPFDLREMILTYQAPPDSLLSFRLGHRSAKDRALRRQVLQVTLIPWKRISRTILDTPFQQPRLGQASFLRLVLLQCRGSTANAELDALTWTVGRRTLPRVLLKGQEQAKLTGRATSKGPFRRWTTTNKTLEHNLCFNWAPSRCVGVRAG